MRLSITEKRLVDDMGGERCDACRRVSHLSAPGVLRESRSRVYTKHAHGLHGLHGLHAPVCHGARAFCTSYWNQHMPKQVLPVSAHVTEDVTGKRKRRSYTLSRYHIKSVNIRTKRARTVTYLQNCQGSNLIGTKVHLLLLPTQGLCLDSAPIQGTLCASWMMYSSGLFWALYVVVLHCQIPNHSTIGIVVAICLLWRLYFAMAANKGSMESPQPSSSICMVGRQPGSQQCLQNGWRLLLAPSNMGQELMTPARAKQSHCIGCSNSSKLRNL